jgi:hypothetical protein
MPRLTVRSMSLGDIFQDMVRVHLDHRPDARAGRVIVIRANGRVVRALARGAPANSKSTIHLDQATREKLDVSIKQEVEFTIEVGDPMDELLWAWNATNAMPRVAARLGVVSVALGLIGLILGIISLAK